MSGLLWSDAWATAKKTIINEIPALILRTIASFLILGGILGGVFTPTEASAVAAAYALFVSLFLLKSMTLADLPVVHPLVVKWSKKASA